MEDYIVHVCLLPIAQKFICHYRSVHARIGNRPAEQAVLRNALLQVMQLSAQDKCESRARITDRVPDELHLALDP